MTAIELSKKLCKENEGKVLIRDDVDPENVVIYCNRPDQIILPNGETNWRYEKGTFTNKHSAESGVYEIITVLPRFYINN